MRTPPPQSNTIHNLFEDQPQEPIETSPRRWEAPPRGYLFKIRFGQSDRGFQSDIQYHGGGYDG